MTGNAFPLMCTVLAALFAGTAVLAEKPPAQKPAAEPIAVFGEVHKQGSHEFVAGMTLKVALEAAGGLTANADGENVSLRRIGAAIGSVNATKALLGDAIQNVALEPGDTLYVPRKALKPADSSTGPKPTAAAPSAVDPSTRIAIVGSVAQPGTYIFHPVMIKEAIKAAGGVSKDADQKKIVIRRGYLIDPPSSRSFNYDHDAVNRGRAPDIHLLPGDVIDVPKRGSKTFFGSVGGAMSKVAKLLGSVAKPLISAAAPAVIGSNHRASNPSTHEIQMTGGRVPTGLESALLRAIAVEPPDVRERIYSHSKLYLAASPAG